MLDEVTVPLARILAVTLWIVGAALVGLQMLGMFYGGQLGLLLAGLGGVLSIRTMLHQNQERERCAYELGRESGTEESSLRSIH